MKRLQMQACAIAATVVSIVVASASSQAVVIDWAEIGNPGNDDDIIPGGGLPAADRVGAVSYTYRISKHEITNDQYAEFLQAKATVGDPLELYNAMMDTDPRGGIFRSGSGSASDPFQHDVKSNMGNKPVNFVSWYDAVRFVNWLHNGQSDGDTESGAYELLGGTPVPTNQFAIDRSPNAQFFIPSNDEWHKAAYFEPGAVTDDGNEYWKYATRSDLLPASATANLVGDISPPGNNIANFDQGADWNSLDGNVTTVGSAGVTSYSYYGAADMNGNVQEWLEEFSPSLEAFWGVRGGEWRSSYGLHASHFGGSIVGWGELDTLGFRVASVPEPATSLALAFEVIIAWRRHIGFRRESRQFSATRAGEFRNYVDFHPASSEVEFLLARK